MLKTVLVLNISLEIVSREIYIFQDTLINRKFKRTVFIWDWNLCNIVNHQRVRRVQFLCISTFRSTYRWLQILQTGN